MTAIAKDHKFSGFKHKYIVLQFWKSEVQNRFLLDQNQVSAGLCSFCSSRRESTSFPFPASYKDHCGYFAIKTTQDNIPISKPLIKGFPGSPVAKNPPCKAGDAGSIPDLGTKISRATKPTHHN